MKKMERKVTYQCLSTLVRVGKVSWQRYIPAGKVICSFLVGIVDPIRILRMLFARIIEQSLTCLDQHNILALTFYT